jgi:hypothetical protein
MKKSLLIITGLVLFFLFSQNVLAALLPVTPKCEIEASIIEGKKELITYPDPDLKDETMYSLRLEITKIGKMIGQGWTGQTCENSFNIGQIIETSVFKERDLRNQSDELRNGQIISFHVQGVKDEFSKEPWFQIDGVRFWNAGITIIKDVEETPENKIDYEKKSNILFSIIPIFVVILFVILYLIYKKRKNKRSAP